MTTFWTNCSNNSLRQTHRVRVAGQPASIDWWEISVRPGPRHWRRSGWLDPIAGWWAGHSESWRWGDTREAESGDSLGISAGAGILIILVVYAYPTVRALIYSAVGLRQRAAQVNLKLVAANPTNAAALRLFGLREMPIIERLADLFQAYMARSPMTGRSRSPPASGRWNAVRNARFRTAWNRAGARSKRHRPVSGIAPTSLDRGPGGRGESEEDRPAATRAARGCVDTGPPLYGGRQHSTRGSVRLYVERLEGNRDDD